jgi:hypothetical protein
MMLVSPFPVFILFATSRLRPVMILAMVFLKKAAIGSVFIVVPRVVVFVGPIVRPLAPPRKFPAELQSDNATLVLSYLVS